MQSKKIGVIKLNSRDIYSMLFLLWPILNIYGFFSEMIGVGDVFIIIASFCMFFSFSLWKYDGNYRYIYFKYLLFSLIITIFSYFLTETGNMYGIMLFLTKKIVYVYIFAVLAPRIIEMKYFLSQYRKICVLLSMIVMVQCFLHFFIGFSEPFIINNALFPVVGVGGYEDYIYKWHLHLLYESYKAPSLFSEAAKYAQYVSPCLLLSLIYKDENENFLFEIFISISLVITFSANAVVFTIVSWCCWIVFSRDNKHKNTKYFVAFLGGVMSVLFIIYDTWFRGRLNEIGNGLSSGSMRLLRGWIIFGKLPLLQKIIGVGLGNVASYIQIAHITTIYDAGYIGYMSGLSEVAVASGIIAFFAFLLVFFIYYYKGGKLGKGLSILSITMLSSSAILDNSTFAIMIMLLELAVFKEILLEKRLEQ